MSSCDLILCSTQGDAKRVASAVENVYHVQTVVRRFFVTSDWIVSVRDAQLPSVMAAMSVYALGYLNALEAENLRDYRAAMRR